MKRFLKSLTLLFCCVLILGALVGCQKVEEYKPEATEPDVYQSEEVFYCNGVDRYGADTLILPEFEIDAVDGHSIDYKNVTALKMNAYCAKMEKNGFTVVRYDYITYFYSDTCWIEMTHSKDFESGVASLRYCTETAMKPENAISAEKAKQMIGTDCPHPLIDVTPAGVYEATGGRIFSLPPRGSGQMSAEEYKEYVSIPWDERPRPLYFVTEEYAVPMEMDAVAYADADGNGIKEVWVLGYGPTSGLFTFELSGYENGERKYHSTFYVDHGTLGFCQRDGKLRVFNDVYFYGKEEIEHREYEIGIDGTYLVLYENGTPVNRWGQYQEP